MYFITNPSELVDKEIEFVHFVKYAEAMVIITKDKGVFVFNKNKNEEVEVFDEARAKEYILKTIRVRDGLYDLGIITIDEIMKYQEELESRWRKEAEDREKARVEHEYKTYLQLRKKYQERYEIESTIDMKKFKKLALDITREDFIKQNEGICLYTAYGIGHKRTVEHCEPNQCKMCKQEVISSVKFKGE